MEMDGAAIEEKYIKPFLKGLLARNELLVTAFSDTTDNCAEEMHKKYRYLLEVIEEKYPHNHPFRHSGFVFDGTAFSLAYCLYIVPKYLHNTEMMVDMIEKKLISQVDNKFSLKLFNEGFSELEIFLYIIIGLFCYSGEYSNFDRLVYEPSGSNNKRFEYAFLMKNGKKINVEVKALECEPEYSDNVNLIKMNDGQLFYKNYFAALDELEVVPNYIRENAIKLKSNYRQISKNVKKIYEKCEDKSNDVNIGFMMINYGTSREEFISYLLNEQYGYLHRNPMQNHNVDALVLFSMCIDTDLMMNRILDKEHIFVFANSARIDRELLEKMRLSNFIDGTEGKYARIAEECYGEYEGINRGGIVTIQRRLSPEDQNELKKYIKWINDREDFNKLTKILLSKNKEKDILNSKKV